MSVVSDWHLSTSIRLASIEEVLKAKAYICFVSFWCHLKGFAVSVSDMVQYEKVHA